MCTGSPVWGVQGKGGRDMPRGEKWPGEERDRNGSRATHNTKPDWQKAEWNRRVSNVREREIDLESDKQFVVFTYTVCNQLYRRSLVRSLRLQASTHTWSWFPGLDQGREREWPQCIDLWTPLATIPVCKMGCTWEIICSKKGSQGPPLDLFAYGALQED